MTRVTKSVEASVAFAAVAGSIITLRAIANQCTAGACPTVYVPEAPDLEETAMAVVQGYVVPSDRVGIDVPEGEVLVQVPVSLLTEAVRNLTGQQSPPGGMKGV